MIRDDKKRSYSLLRPQGPPQGQAESNHSREFASITAAPADREEDEDGCSLQNVSVTLTPLLLYLPQEGHKYGQHLKILGKVEQT